MITHSPFIELPARSKPGITVMTSFFVYFLPLLEVET